MSNTECIIYNFDLIEPVRVRDILKSKKHDDEKTEEIILKLISSKKPVSTPTPLPIIRHDRKQIKVDESEHAQEPCQNCGSTRFVRTGVCYTCLICATTTGCS